MALYLSHISAAQCWLSARFDSLLDPTGIAKSKRPIGSLELERVASACALKRLRSTHKKTHTSDDQGRIEHASKPTMQTVRSITSGQLAFVTKPLHIAIPDISLRNCCKNTICHLCTTHVPAGSFIRLEDALFVACPEFCFIQMATQLPFHHLVKLGIELCGTYSLQPDGQTTYNRPIPVTSVRALQQFIEVSPGLPGIKAAKRALRYIAVSSASPMETALVIMLCLPLRLGGYGLPLPRMNYRIDVHAESRAVAKKHYYLCDLYWPKAHLCVEYDSDQEHTGSARIANDALRRNDLTRRGITMITATRKQVLDSRKLDQLAHQVGRALGVRIRDERGWSPNERARLLRSLTRTTGPSESWTKRRVLPIPK